MTDMWSIYRARLATKALAELCHEQVLTPELGADGRYRATSDDGSAEYSFIADVLALDSWCIDESSVQRTPFDKLKGPEVDPLTVITDFADSLGLAGDNLAGFLEELINTLTLAAGRADEQRRTAAELATPTNDPVVAFQAIEAAMTEGHPCFLANAGRVGFSVDDLPRYAPEFGPRMDLRWLALQASDVEFAAMSGIDYDGLILTELGADQKARFDAVLAERGLDPTDYRYLPVHPWQWSNRGARLFAPELASGAIVDVGVSDDQYQPQQSIRTLFNASQPTRHYTKVSLSITNMGFTRGMSADYMSTTPLINDWVRGRLQHDEYLNSIGFEVLYEVAAAGYRNPTLNAITEPGSEYRKIVAALWRESPIPLLREHEQLATMASLLHVDHTGAPLVGAFMQRSGLAPRQWLRQYLDAYLHPIIYLLYAHELKFSPHGENLILALRDGVPVRTILKDIGEEVFILGAADDLPEACARARSHEADGSRNLGILSDVFDDFFRPLAALLHRFGLITDTDFWWEVSAAVNAFQAQHPDLLDRFDRWDLFAPDFGAIHLNQLQLSNRTRMTDHIAYEDMVARGHRLANPIAGSLAGASRIDSDQEVSAS